MGFVNLAQIEKIIADVAQTEIMTRFRKLGSDDIEMKGINDPVTVADKAAEKALTTRLTDACPGSVVVGEESFAANPAIASYLNGDGYLWIIDPVDGTSNFINGVPEFATMVALLHHGRTLASWIHDPVTRDTLMAEAGGGVFLDNHKMVLAGRDLMVPDRGVVSRRIRILFDQAKDITRTDSALEICKDSSSSFDYARLFAGERVFANSEKPRTSFFLASHSRPWDHLPGLLMVKEAQGYAADLQGHVYAPTLTRNAGMLVAANRPIWDQVYQTFNPNIRPFLQGEGVEPL